MQKQAVWPTNGPPTKGPYSPAIVFGKPACALRSASYPERADEAASLWGRNTARIEIAAPTSTIGNATHFIADTLSSLVSSSRPYTGKWARERRV